MENLILEQQKELEKLVKVSFSKTEEAEIDEGNGAEEEAEADVREDPTDLGARADYEWSKEKDERLGL